MSDRLPYPRDPNEVRGGMLGATQDILRLLRLVFFPPRGKGLVQRVDELEQRVAALENKPS